MDEKETRVWEMIGRELLVKGQVEPSPEARKVYSEEAKRLGATALRSTKSPRSVAFWIQLPLPETRSSSVGQAMGERS